MCKYCENNIVITPNDGPQLEFGLNSGKFGDVIKLSINPYRKEMHVEVDKFQHPAIVDQMCMLYNAGILDITKDFPPYRYAVWKIKYCPFCGKKLDK